MAKPRNLKVAHDDVGHRQKTGAYIGYAGLARVLACTQRGARASDVVRRTGIASQRSRELLKQFMALNIIHRVKFHRRTNEDGTPKPGFFEPEYRIGPGENCPAPLNGFGKPQGYADHVKKLEQRVVAFASVIQALAEPITLVELEHQSGVTRSRLYELVSTLRELGLARISAWQYKSLRIGGPPTPLWQMGGGEDAPPPPPRGRTPRLRASRSQGNQAWVNSMRQLKALAGFESAIVRERPIAEELENA